jgi:serine/threonine protein kinase
MFQE